MFWVSARFHARINLSRTSSRRELDLKSSFTSMRLMIIGRVPCVHRYGYHLETTRLLPSHAVGSCLTRGLACRVFPGSTSSGTARTLALTKGKTKLPGCHLAVGKNRDKSTVSIWGRYALRLGLGHLTLRRRDIPLPF